jgi:hypothetical protein
MSVSTFSIPQYSFQATTPSPTGTLSLGYWFRTVGAVSNISLVLIDDSEFSNFQSGAAFSYYVFWSRINTNLVWFPTQTMSSVAAPRRFIVYGVNFAATTVVGGSNLINAACIPTSPCLHGGICNTGRTCDCPPEWSGADCSTPVCSAVTCNSHQTCSAPDVCTCQTGWSGSTCNVPTCTPACAAGQGTCTSPNTCTCAAGFSGSSCSGVDGGYSSFGPLGSCRYDASTGTCVATQYRTCTSPVPSNGGRDCTALGSPTQASACVCPPIDGGYTEWTRSNPSSGCTASPVSSSGCAIAQQRTCTNPAPQFAGRDCSSLGPAQRSLPCACTPAGVDSSASSAISSFALPTQCNSLARIAVDEVTGIVYAGCAAGGVLAIWSTTSSQMVLSAGQCIGGPPLAITVAGDSSVLISCLQPGVLQLNTTGQTHVLVPQSFTCQGASDIAIEPSSNDLYVACLSGVVSVSGSVASSLTLPSACSNPFGVFVENGLVYVGCATVTDSVGLIAVNTTSGTVQSVSSEQLCTNFHPDGAGAIYALCVTHILQVRRSSAATVITIPAPVSCIPNDIAVSRRTGVLYVSCASDSLTPPSNGPIIAIDTAGAAYAVDSGKKCSQATGHLSLNDHAGILYATCGSSLMAYNTTLRLDMRIAAAADDNSTHGGFTWTATWIAIVAGGGAGLLLVAGGSVVAYFYYRRRANVHKIHSSEVTLQRQPPWTHGTHTTAAPVIMHVGYNGSPAASPHYTTGP